MSLEESAPVCLAAIAGVEMFPLTVELCEVLRRFNYCDSIDYGESLPT